MARGSMAVACLVFFVGGAICKIPPSRCQEAPASASQSSKEPESRTALLEDTWRALFDRSQWVDLEAAELQQQNVPASLSQAEQFLTRMEEVWARSSAEPMGAAPEVVGPFLVAAHEALPEFHTKCVWYHWKQRGESWIHERLALEPGDTHAIDLRTPIVSASAAFLGKECLASVTGPLKDHQSFSCARAEWLFLNTGWNLLTDTPESNIRRFMSQTAFTDAVKSRQQSVALEWNDHVTKGQVEITGTSRAVYDQGHAYLPVESHYETATGAGRLTKGFVRLAYDDSHLPLPRMVLACHWRQGATPDTALVSLRVFALTNVVFAPERQAALRLPIPKNASIEDRTTRWTFEGLAARPERWPDHWWQAFDPGVPRPTVAKDVYAPEVTARHDLQEGARRWNAWTIAGGGLLFLAGGWVLLARRRLRTKGPA